MTKIVDLVHPDYGIWEAYWYKWRLTYEGGYPFVDTYLEKYSSRESDTDFKSRKAISYCPAFAKAAINDIKNAIFQRIVDTTRVGGTPSYQQAVESKLGGVDNRGSSMTSFIGRKILPELLTMAKVGVYIDAPTLPERATLDDTRNLHPYLYEYGIEDIRSWEIERRGEENIIKAILLRDTVYVKDTEHNLPTDTATRFRYLYIGTDGYVHLRFYDEDGIVTNRDGNQQTIEYTLNIKTIPFVLFEIPTSLLVDVADYQVALLNMESSDIGYILKSNYPFYTEQYDPRTEMPHMKPFSSADEAGEETETKTAKQPEIRVGATQGRRYPVNLDRPGFIHPSSEPLNISIQKEDQLKRDIRLLVNLAVTNLDPKMASAESKSLDNQGLESGLSFIGLILENGERQIAKIWAEYENSKQVATVNYPRNYSLKTEDDRQREAEGKEKLMQKIPSVTYQKEVAKEIAEVTLGGKVRHETLLLIFDEIDSAETITCDAKTIDLDLQNGLVSDETASKARGYPKGEVEKARKDRAERIALVKEAQGGEDGQARGDRDTQIDQPDSTTEKEGKMKRSEDRQQRERT